MQNLRKVLLATCSAIALLAAPVAMADFPGTSVTQTATHLDAATVWVGQSNGVTACNSVSETSAQDTISVGAVAGQYFYLTQFILQKSTDATGATEVPTISMTNIANGGNGAAFLSAASTLSTTSGAYFNMPISFGSGGLKSAAAGVAVTFVPSAALSAHTIMCNSITGYYNAN